MATKKASSAPTKATPSRKPAASKITGATITFRLTPAEVKRAKECLAKTGSIRYTFKDVRVTKLPHVLDDGKLID
jgi:hypothetical protein